MKFLKPFSMVEINLHIYGHPGPIKVVSLINLDKNCHSHMTWAWGGIDRHSIHNRSSSFCHYHDEYTLPSLLKSVSDGWVEKVKRKLILTLPGSPRLSCGPSSAVWGRWVQCGTWEDPAWTNRMDVDEEG